MWLLTVGITQGLTPLKKNVACMKVTDLTGLKPFIKIDEELGLHLARPELAEAIFKAVDKDRLYLRQWLPWVDGTRSAADSAAFIQHSMKMNASGDQLITFLIWKGQLAGSLGVVKFIKDRKSCEVGYWLRSDLQGKGIMTRACTAFI
ncbi:MAG: GNAT family N-acetyltransferase, partial [Bacteroidetes bacterium]